MRGKLSILLTIFKLSFGFVPALASNLILNNDNNFIEDELIIKFTENTELTKNKNKFRVLKTAHKKNTGLLKKPIALMKLEKKYKKEELDELIKEIKKTAKEEGLIIEEIYPNYIYQADSVADPAFREQQTKLVQAYKYYDWAKQKGYGAVVAVIDSGINFEHFDLKDNIWTNPNEIAANGIDDDNNGFIDDIHGYDFVKNSSTQCASGEDCKGRDASPTDFDGHGSHIAGIIAAAENKKGITGIAPKAKIMPLRASYSDGRSTFFKASDIIEAISYAIEEEADVINMSFTGPEHKIISDLLKIADELGIVSVAAAGNASRHDEQYPAALAEVIAVGAIDHDGQKASFSNYGSWVDIAAPGVNILSSSATNSDFEIRSGTSMAAPYVAGIAALIKSKDAVRQLSAREIRQRIIAAATASTDAPILSADIKHPVEVEEMELPRLVSHGREIVFTAKADQATQFRWSSNLDGDLSNENKFSTNNLSIGLHEISLAVAANGNWSSAVKKTMHVVEADQTVISGNTEVTIEIIRRGKQLIANTDQDNKNFIQHYFWQSTKDGILEDSRVISLNDLSEGFHKLSLSIQAADGSISDAIDLIVEVKQKKKNS